MTDDSLAKNFTLLNERLDAEPLEDELVTDAVYPLINSSQNKTCNFCNKAFSSIGNLVRHQKTAKLCLKVQDKKYEREYKCPACDYLTGLKANLDKHILRCKFVAIRHSVEYIKERNSFLESQLDKNQTKNFIDERVLTHHNANDNRNEPTNNKLSANQLTLYKAAEICQPVVYEKLLEQKTMVTISDFIYYIGLSVDMFQIDQFWDGWKHPAKYMIVNKDMLDWLGYEGDYKTRRQNLLQLLKSNFQADTDYVYDGSLEATMIIGTGDKQPKEKMLAVSWVCLKQISMMLQTKKSSEIRSSTIRQEMLFRLYMQYQHDLQSRQRNTENTIEINKLKRKVANHEKAHRYVKFSLDSAYYCFSYGRKCVQGCPTRDLIKHGIAKKGSDPIDVRIQTHRTTFKILVIEFIISAPPDIVKALEHAMELCYGENLNPNASEIFDKVGASVLKKKAIEFLEVICPDQYSIIPQDKIDEYNEDVDHMIKDNIVELDDE